MATIKYFCLKHRKPVVLSIVLASTAAILWSSGGSKNTMEVPVTLDQFSNRSLSQPHTVPAQSTSVDTLTYTVKSHDTLGSIFTKLDLPQATMYRLLEADQDFLQLDNLMPGQELRFHREGDNKLVTRMETVIDSVHTLVFVRQGDGYSGEMQTHVTNIVERSVYGSIDSSLYRSASRVGLNPTEIDQVSRLFEDKVNFTRDLRSGDTFHMLYDDVYVGDTPTGRSTLKAVVFILRGKQQAAFLHDDGQYYDETGQSLNRAFLNRPVPGRYRISSHFNPNRRHPITKQVRPHKGTDYATPIGTKALAISDGIVTRVGHHPAAGRHLTIQHNDTYSTRYLHLNKILVRQGQRVSIGDVVAHTGNTGMSTGPHLHFELHRNGAAVNYVTHVLPEGKQLEPNQMLAFRELVNQYLAKLNIDSESQLVATASQKTNKA